MGFSFPRRSWLYRNALVAVILLGCTLGAWTWIFAQGTIARYGRKAAASKGPRALGLIMLSPKGKARLTPIAIMVDGKFYDAGSYKGKPVPMALDFGVVYEGFRAGVSQGLFTITQPGQLNHEWMAEGTWLPAGAKPPETSKKYETPVIEDKDAPPVLHRRNEKPPSNTSEPQKPTPPPSTPAPSATAAPTAAKAPPEPASIDDPNRPVLRRGKPDPKARREAVKAFDEDEFATKSKTATESKGATTAAKAPVQIIPAISDAGGPDPRPYTYEVKPEEEASYRAKMLDLAATEVRARMKTAAPMSAAAKRRVPVASKPAQPSFDDVQLRIFDLSNTNQPVLVLSAQTHLPGEDMNEPKEITLVARTNLEGELRRLFFSETDSRHLDVEPRMELIDAVDADGDGRGELLFRRTSDAGSAYGIYRVTADQLWPLYEGTP
jgi:hypothetical protein